MISYILFSLLLMASTCLITKKLEQVRGVSSYRYRLLTSLLFVGTMVPLVICFIRHKVDRIPGAYTTYAFFEWSLIFWDVGFDAVSAIDLEFITFTAFTPKSSSSSSQTPSTFVSPLVVLGAMATNLPIANTRKALVDVYLAYVFWSLLTMIPLTIWYFPLWNMGLSGYEILFFVTICAGLQAFKIIQRLTTQFEGIFHLLSMIGVASYMFPEPTTRLLCVGIGGFFSTLVWTGKLFHLGQTDDQNAKYQIPKQHGHLLYYQWELMSWLLGLMLCNVMKYGWYSNDPIWSIMRSENSGINTFALFAGILASFQVISRGRRAEEKAFEDDGHELGSPSLGKGKRKDSSKMSMGIAGKWWHGAVGFGSLLFSLHHNVVDSGLLCRWAVIGYPIMGPEPATFGPVVVLASLLGIAMGFVPETRDMAVRRTWWTAATVGLYVLYYIQGFIGFAGGLVWVAWLLAIAPVILASIQNYPIGKTLLLGFFVYQMLSFASIWTVAYAFVPGGSILRERTHVVFAMSQLGLYAGISSATLHYPPLQPLTSAFGALRQAATLSRSILWRRARSTSSVLLFVLGIFFLGRMWNRAAPIVPYHAKDKLFTGGIWTIHFGLDNNMWESHLRMANLIQELELDVVGLLESDTSRVIGGNRDLTQFLAERLHMYADYGPGPTSHTWGCSMLSKFPIKRSTHHLLPSPVGELACAIHATLDVHNVEVDVIVSHNGQEEDFLDRKLQTHALAKIMNTSTNPFVFLGYVVTKPHDYLYKVLSENGNVKDIDAQDDDRWCQYIFYRGVKRVGYARVSHGRITDTEVQTGKFVVRDKQENDDWWKDTTGLVPETEVPRGYRYPEQFKSPGVRGHMYHVFPEPKYFQ